LVSHYIDIQIVVNQLVSIHPLSFNKNRKELIGITSRQPILHLSNKEFEIKRGYSNLLE
jgi:hypothetical protein